MLEINNLSISFTQYQRGLKQNTLQVISDLSMSVKEGEILAVIGSSGSGKSLLAHAILGILPKNAITSGSILYKGEKLTPQMQKKLRGKEITLIPQSVNFLNPLMRIGAQVYSPDDSNWKEKQEKIFARYSLDSKVGRLFPFQLSGGMLRRVLVASAVVGGAKLIIADEPTPGLHPEVLQETLLHLRELADEGCAVILITHDIGPALDIADNVAVLYSGTVVEIAPSKDFTGNGELLGHPYAKALWSALPQNGFLPIASTQPSYSEQFTGCLFEPRCAMKTSVCMNSIPIMRELRSGKIRCHNAT